MFGFQPPNNFPSVLAAFITILLTLDVMPKAWGQDLFWTGNAANPAIAGSGTWVTPEPPGFFSWSSTSTSNTPANWVDGSVAHFLGSNGGTATLGSDITAAGINFDPGANAFTIDTNLNRLTIEGTGIVNNSGKTQTIINNVSTGSGARGETIFNNASTAGSATIMNNGGAGSAGAGGETRFNNASTAGNAKIVNNGGFSISNSGTAVTGEIGNTQFLDTSTAGNATITNNGGSTGGEIGGFTTFSNASTAGGATIINNGAAVSGALHAGSFTLFVDTSTAANAKIINNGGTASGAGGGVTLFVSTPSLGLVSAGSATITNNGGTVRGAGGGVTSFFSLTAGNATAGNATITNNGGTVSGAGGGVTSFFSSTAGNATIITNGGTGGGLGGTTAFVGNSDGGTARAITNGNGLFDISGLTAPGMRIGSIEGSGIYFLGNKTLTVSGNYTQNANGTLGIAIAGLGTGQHGLLAIGGHASLAGTLQLISLDNFQLHAGDKLTLITANGGVSGAFSAIQNPFPTTVKPQIAFLSNAVVLEGTQTSFVQAACNSNSAAVAHALDNSVGNPQAAGLINFLNSQPVNALCPAFTLIAPQELASVYNVGIATANVQSSNLGRRMADVRAGSTGFSAAGFTMNGVTPSYSSGLSGPTGPEGKAGPSALAPIPENRWGVFITGSGEFTHVGSTNAAPGYDLQTGGFTLGVDYRIGSNFAIGLMGGYSHTNGDLANGGNLDVNTGNFGLYATAFSGGFYLDTAVTGGINGYDSHRTALLGTASGSTNGGDLNVLVSGGYDWKKGGLTIGPIASFQYTYVSLDGFTETGSLAPLKLNDQHIDSYRTAFGGKASYDWKVGHILVRPELRMAWQHEYGNSAYSIVASFANGAGGSFTVSSPRIGRDSLLLGAGAALLWTDRISTYVYYDGELARTNYNSQNVSGGVRITF